jgi:hypothetical protein
LARRTAPGNGEAAGHPPAAGLVHAAQAAIHHSPASVEVDRQPAPAEERPATLKPDVADHRNQPLFQVVDREIAARGFAWTGDSHPAARINAVDVDPILAGIGECQPGGTKRQAALPDHHIAGEDCTVGAILGLGAIEKRPKVITGPDGEDTIAIRTCAYFSLSFDHRIVDGADADKFLAYVKKELESYPETIA